MTARGVSASQLGTLPLFRASQNLAPYGKALACQATRPSQATPPAPADSPHHVMEIRPSLSTSAGTTRRPALGTSHSGFRKQLQPVPPRERDEYALAGHCRSLHHGPWPTFCHRPACLSRDFNPQLSKRLWRPPPRPSFPHFTRAHTSPASTLPPLLVSSSPPLLTHFLQSSNTWSVIHTLPSRLAFSALTSTSTLSRQVTTSYRQSRARRLSSRYTDSCIFDLLLLLNY